MLPGSPDRSTADQLASLPVIAVSKSFHVDPSPIGYAQVKQHRWRHANALIDVQAQVEAHIAARYALPVDPVPVLLQSVIADMARARLYPNGAPDGIGGAARAALRTLERIQSGDIGLGIVAPASAASETPICILGGVRTYPDGLQEY